MVLLTGEVIFRPIGSFDHCSLARKIQLDFPMPISALTRRVLKSRIHWDGIYHAFESIV